MERQYNSLVTKPGKHKEQGYATEQYGRSEYFEKYSLGIVVREWFRR